MWVYAALFKPAVVLHKTLKQPAGPPNVLDSLIHLTKPLCCISGASRVREVQQFECFKTAKLSETVVIKCQTKAAWRTRVWYKLGTNRSLQIIASTDNLFQQNEPVDYHYSMKSSDSETTLTIKYMTKEDVGTYYCGIINTQDVLFGSGTVLELEGESKPMQSVLQSPDYIKVQPGDSVTLSCSFNTSHCPQDHTSLFLSCHFLCIFVCFFVAFFCCNIEISPLCRLSLLTSATLMMLVH
uniref:Ig-like domain-containing protein n=1 Tax=Periophthalmus magnuspinnatus TaxID=409849 RepID=A0A3B4ARI3_9GOBI